MPELWHQCGGFDAVLGTLAGQCGKGKRTLYQWLDPFRSAGIAGTAANIPRRDKGQSRKFNAAGREFVLGAGSPPAERSNGPTKHIPEICRLLRRGAGLSRGPCRMRKPLSQAERRRHRPDTQNSRRPGSPQPGQLVTQGEAKSTIARWFNLDNRKRRAQWRAMAKKPSTTPRKSSRIETAPIIRPLDWCVIDHRRLDRFCLAPADRGWLEVGAALADCWRLT